VLKSEKEVSFEERLELENAVRGLENEKILNSWRSFTESNTDLEAQTRVRNLLETLVGEIIY